MANNLDIYAPEVWWKGTMGPLHKRTVLAGIAWTQPSNELARYGDTINIQLPGTFSVNDKTEGSDVTVQSITDAVNVPVVLNKYKEVTFQISSWDAKNSMADLVTLYMEPAAEVLARQIETDGMTELFKYARLVAGTAGTTPDAMQDIADVTNQLDVALAPDNPRHVILGSAAYTKMLGTSDFHRADAQGNNNTLRTGRIGTIFDTDVHKSLYIPSITTPDITDTAAEIDYGAGYAAGTTAIHIDGLGASVTGAIQAGAILAITHSAASKTVNYVVSATVNSDSNGDADVVLTSGLEYAVADGDDITILTGSNVTAVKNIALHPQAICFVSRPLVEARDYPNAKVYNYNYKGTTLTAVLGFDRDALAWQVTLSVAYGWKVIRKDYAALLLG